MRRTAALVLAAGLVIPLAACSSSNDEEAAADCSPTASGSVSDAVEVTGAFGEKPEVTIATPVTAETTERTVVIEGDGEVAAEDYDVTIDYTMFNGTTGEEIDATPYDGESAVGFPLDGSLIAGLTSTLLCSTVGSRVVGVAAPADGLNETALETYGMTAEDALVIVADVVTAEEPADVEPALPKADGEDQDIPADFPDITVSVADDETGTPTVTLPDTAAPTELQVAVLKQGDGEEVPADADVVVNYQGTAWSTKEIFDQSWGTGSTAAFNTSGLIDGFAQAIEGQQVGSQILVVIPPALAYGEPSETNTSELAGETLVFVIDILGLG
ncbi:peptidylprolyl isomerase [Glaciihabitans tibetensis]|uniref:peptidylprolyl isomerase n=1 Tax=Glaciihabitans tibetensis TaxID=1266600 RepID=A0A2T0VHF2_9MICO|nr:FKBP-type peptidyl-prolyl cis-trans isomerase [Glaciihabitans tibetensis]PRY69630.1 peptidylprolyl isomerase [Glaciihabitans tibetensis]